MCRAARGSRVTWATHAARWRPTTWNARLVASNSYQTGVTYGQPSASTVAIRAFQGSARNRSSSAPSRLPIRSSGTNAMSADLRARVERVAQPVADDVEGQHREHDGGAGKERDPRRQRQELLALVQDRSPRRQRRLHADPEVRQRRLEQDCVRQRSEWRRVGKEEEIG